MSLSLFNLYAECIVRNAGLDESKARVKSSERNINNLRYADDAILMAESEEELKILLMNVKEESEKAGLKLNIQKAWYPVLSLHGKLMGKKWNQRQILFSWAPKSLDSDCSHEIRRQSLLDRKAMTNRDSVLKSRDITLLTKVL